MQDNVLVSVIILARNQKEFLSKSLPIIYEQDHKNIEVILMDSSSTDGTLDLAEEYPIKIIKYSGSVGRKFNYAEAFNQAAKEASGEIIVRLSGDAIPSNEQWLSNLIRPFSNPKVAGAYSGQIHSNSSDWGHKLWCFIVFSRYRLVFKKLVGSLMFWGASCAMRKELWEEVPFNENQKVAEDSRWSLEIERVGYETVYVSDSLVYHSHHRGSSTMLRIAWRTIKIFTALFIRMFFYRFERLFSVPKAMRG